MILTRITTEFSGYVSISDQVDTIRGVRTTVEVGDMSHGKGDAYPMTVRTYQCFVKMFQKEL